MSAALPAGCIVGLDLSLTSTGIAVLTPCANGVRPIRLRSVGEDGRRDDDYQRRSRRVRAQASAVLRTVMDATDGGHIALVVLEGPIYAGKLLPSYFDRAGLFHGVYGAFDARDVPIAVIPNNTGHQFVTGRARPADSKKSDIVEEAAKWWPNGPRVHNSDEADALGLAVMGAMHLGHKPPFWPRARHYNAIASASWPGGPRKLGQWA